MAQQTSVIRLEEKLKTYLSWSSFLEEDFEQAKAMEKENLKNAVIYGLDEDGHTGDWKISVAENYYIKTYTNAN